MVDGVVPADREQLERARAAATAMSGVIVQLRELVDVEAAALLRSPRRVAMAELLAEVGQALEPYYRDHGVALAIDPAATAEVDVDPTQVSRALRNVLSNAAQHSPPGARVDVTTEEAGADVVVRVADQGSGIAVDDLPHIFERFYRADPARSGGEPRSGIGLTIARELLAANGGGIEVERTGPDGTTFALRLPRPAAG
jgi:signal transduction histidine kinase